MRARQPPVRGLHCPTTGAAGEDRGEVSVSEVERGLQATGSALGAIPADGRARCLQPIRPRWIGARRSSRRVQFPLHLTG